MPFDDDYVGGVVSDAAENQNNQDIEQEQQKAVLHEEKPVVTKKNIGAGKDELISVLNGRKSLTNYQLAQINSVQIALGLRDDDPLLAVLIPAVLSAGRSEEVLQELRELLSHNNKSQSSSFDFEEAQKETLSALHNVSNKLEKQVKRAVNAALAETDLPSAATAPSGGVVVDNDAIAQKVTSAFKIHINLSRAGIAAGVLISCFAVGFLSGVFLNKSGYEKLVNQLESKVQAYEIIVNQGQGVKK